jgi:SAM-dependent methyltransferase
MERVSSILQRLQRLWNPKTPRPFSPQEILARAVQCPPWCVDHASLIDGELEIRGWTLNPGGGAVRFQQNGQDFAQVEFPHFREDIARIFWFVPGAGQSGFVCRGRAATATLAELPSGAFEISRQISGVAVFDQDAPNYYYLDPSRDGRALPDPQRRARVHGGTSESSFRLEGFTTFVKLRQTLRRWLQRDFEDFPTILDWGCGCGRFTRHLAGLRRAHVIGIDIDRDNVDWCQQNLGDVGSFQAVELNPPTPLPAASVDLVIGISIFTHLKEREQFEWLAELRRILKRGGWALVTVHGQTAIARSGLPLEQVAAWHHAGFFDGGVNPDLTGAIPDPSYYRNSFHTADYITRQWGRYFKVRRLLPGYIGNFQDLVLLERR